MCAPSGWNAYGQNYKFQFVVREWEKNGYLAAKAFSMEAAACGRVNTICIHTHTHTGAIFVAAS